MSIATVRLVMGAACLALTMMAMVSLAMAALSDLRHRRIGDRIPLTLAGMALLHGLAADRHLSLEAALHLLTALALGTLALGGFFLGMLGGGDVKLMAALGLWLSPHAALVLVLAVAILGALIGMAMVRLYHHRLSAPRTPYGMVIAATGIACLFPLPG